MSHLSTTVGIALAAYQPKIETFLEQLFSIQAQSHTDWICVVTSDSPLNAVVSHPSFLPLLRDRRFVWIENETRLGHKKNFEKAIQTALHHPSAPWAIACSDQDDRWYPEKLEVSLKALKKAPPLSLVHCDMHVLRAGKIETKTAWEIEKRGVEQNQPEHFLTRNMVAGCAMVFDAELARKYPTIPEGAEYHDHWYALVASFYGGVHPIHQPLYAYRQHESNEVGVSPYAGVLALPQGAGAVQIAKKMSKSWEKTRDLAQAANEAGLDLGFWRKFLFLSQTDLGIGFWILGLLALKKDPALARAYFKRAGGKFFRALGL